MTTIDGPVISPVAQRYGRLRFFAMAMKICVEFMSGNVCTMEVWPEMKIRELKEKLKAGWVLEEMLFVRHDFSKGVRLLYLVFLVSNQ
jgi:hypothetical protein